MELGHGFCHDKTIIHVKSSHDHIKLVVIPMQYSCLFGQYLLMSCNLFSCFSNLALVFVEVIPIVLTWTNAYYMCSVIIQKSWSVVSLPLVKMIFTGIHREPVILVRSMRLLLMSNFTWCDLLFFLAARSSVSAATVSESSPPSSPCRYPKSPSPAGVGRIQRHSPSPGQRTRVRSPTPYSASASTTPISSTPPSTPGSTHRFLINPLGIRRAVSQEDRLVNSGSASNLFATQERRERRRNRSCDALLESSIAKTVETVPDGVAVKTNGRQSKSKIRPFTRKISNPKKTERQDSSKSRSGGCLM